MAKMVLRLININPCFKVVSKHVVNSQKLQLNHRNSPNFCSTSSTGILFKHFAAMGCGNVKNVLSFVPHHPNPNTEFVETTHLPSNFEHSLSLKIRGHTHGLVCLSDLDYQNPILLSNPATKNFCNIPWSDIFLEERFPLNTRAVGFGHDTNSNDFKVVRVVMFNHWLNIFDYKVEVFNLSTGMWREIKTPVLLGCYIFWNSSFEICHQGICYWLARNDKDNSCFILSFDVSEEVFRKILLPESFRHSAGGNKSMGVWNGSIVLFHYPWTICGIEKETNIDIWAMESGGVSFSKLFTIDRIFGLAKPLLFLNSDELVMETEDAQVISFNVNTKEVKNLPVKGEYHWMIQGFVFEKSALSFTGSS